MNIWGKASQMIYDEVDEKYPVKQDTPTRINSEGKVVNMSREAMMARVKGLDTMFFGVITGEITND